MKRVVALMLLSMFSVALLAGCNTVAGAGKDVQKAGEKLRTPPRASEPGADWKAKRPGIFPAFCARCLPHGRRSGVNHSSR